MRCPTLSELPPPPPGKTGWPWTEESPQLPDTMPDGRPWPKISIVTPNYNYGQFIEETIRSVLLQGYPNLEYIIIDGGSTDNSVEIIKKYEPWPVYWVSEPDCGMYDAINKGLRLATGDLIGICNADDLYEKEALRESGCAYMSGGCARIICGGCKWFEVGDGRNRTLKVKRPSEASRFTLELLPVMNHINALFMPRSLYESVGGFDAGYRILGDLDFLLKIAMLQPSMTVTQKVLYAYRVHEVSFTNSSQGRPDSRWPIEKRQLALQWLNNEGAHPEVTRFCKDMLASACLWLVTRSVRERRWKQAARWLWEGLQGAPRAMSLKIAKYAYRKSRRRASVGLERFLGAGGLWGMR